MSEDLQKVFSLSDAAGKIESAISYNGASLKLSSKPPRQLALEEAIGLTVGSRDKEYGPPIVNLTQAANLVKAYIGDRQMNSFTAVDMAAVNILIKLSRLANNPNHKDSWVDAAAYAAIGLECAEALATKKA
jgi:hypothetical protein